MNSATYFSELLRNEETLSPLTLSLSKGYTAKRRPAEFVHSQNFSARDETPFDKLRVSGFDKLRVSGFDKLRVSGFDKLRVSGFDKLRVSGRVSGDECVAIFMTTIT